MADARQASIERARVIVGERTRGWVRIDGWGPKCAGCGADEYRVDGYCSCECRDYHDDEDVATLGETIDSLASALAEAERERDDYRRANEAVRVCAAHTTEIVDAPLDCWVCDVAKLTACLVEHHNMATLSDEVLREYDFKRCHVCARAVAPPLRPPSSSGETPEPAEVPGRRAVGLPSAATPAPIRKDGASAGSAPLGWRGVYPGMCIDPQLCEGRGFCPRDRACCE